MSVEQQVQTAMSFRAEKPEFWRKYQEKRVRKKVEGATLVPDTLLTQQQIGFKVNELLFEAQTIDDEKKERAMYPWRQPRNVHETRYIDEANKIIDGIFSMRETVAQQYKDTLEAQADDVPEDTRAYGIVVRMEQLEGEEKPKKVVRVYVTSREK
jgi:hypothetical protein